MADEETKPERLTRVVEAGFEAAKAAVERHGHRLVSAAIVICDATGNDVWCGVRSHTGLVWKDRDGAVVLAATSIGSSMEDAVQHSLTPLIRRRGLDVPGERGGRPS